MQTKPRKGFEIVLWLYGSDFAVGSTCRISPRRWASVEFVAEPGMWLHVGMPLRQRTAFGGTSSARHSLLPSMSGTRCENRHWYSQSSPSSFILGSLWRLFSFSLHPSLLPSFRISWLYLRRSVKSGTAFWTLLKCLRPIILTLVSC
jgi:hypothetical protein